MKIYLISSIICYVVMSMAIYDIAANITKKLRKTNKKYKSISKLLLAHLKLLFISFVPILNVCVVLTLIFQEEKLTSIIVEKYKKEKGEENKNEQRNDNKSC